jgi:hypothetical protein
MQRLLAEGRRTSTVVFDALDKSSRYAASLVEIFDQYDAITAGGARHRPGRAGATGGRLLHIVLTGLPALSLPLFAGESGSSGCRVVGGPGRDAWYCARRARSSRCWRRPRSAPVAPALEGCYQVVTPPSGRAQILREEACGSGQARPPPCCNVRHRCRC